MGSGRAGGGGGGMVKKERPVAASTGERAIASEKSCEARVRKRVVPQRPDAATAAEEEEVIIAVVSGPAATRSLCVGLVAASCERGVGGGEGAEMPRPAKD